MAESTGEKSQQPTQRKLEESFAKGQVARSAEVQTAVVLIAGLMALKMGGSEIWSLMANSMARVLAHLHDTDVSFDALQSYAINAAILVIGCLWPVVICTMVGGLLAGGMQTGFRTTPERLQINWERVNPVEGFKRVFSTGAAVNTSIGLAKLAAIVLLSYSGIKSVINDPIFHSSVSVARIAEFMAGSSFKIITQVCMALVVVAAVDYSYQFWKNHQELMMTREELKEESKNTEGNPEIRRAMRRRRRARAKAKMLAEVPKADVVVTNPTHIAVALRYDRKTMKAPKIVAKGIRLNAARIREIAQEYQVPIVENKPLARLMFKYGKVGGEIPAQLYAAVAEVLAWVYRVNAYRYYRERGE